MRVSAEFAMKIEEFKIFIGKQGKKFTKTKNVSYQLNHLKMCVVKLAPKYYNSFSFRSLFCLPQLFWHKILPPSPLFFYFFFFSHTKNDKNFLPVQSENTLKHFSSFFFCASLCSFSLISSLLLSFFFFIPLEVAGRGVVEKGLAEADVLLKRFFYVINYRVIAKREKKRKEKGSEQFCTHPFTSISLCYFSRCAFLIIFLFLFFSPTENNNIGKADTKNFLYLS